MVKKYLLLTLRSMLLPAAAAAAGIVLVRIFVGGTGPFFWLGVALTAFGLWYLFAALGNYKRMEAAEIEAATGLKFSKGYLFVRLDYLEMKGSFGGSEVTLRRTDGASKYGPFVSQAEFIIKRQAPGMFSMGVYPAGFRKRPFGFFPPPLANQPHWAAEHGLVVRGAPEPAAAAGVEKIWSSIYGNFPVKQLAVLSLSEQKLRAEFIKRGAAYEAGEIKLLLDLCLKICAAG